MNVLEEQMAFVRICVQTTIQRSSAPPSTILKKMASKIYKEIHIKIDDAVRLRKKRDINRALAGITFVPSIENSEPAIICAIHCLLSIIRDTGHGSYLSLENFINYINRAGTIYEMKTDPTIGCWFVETGHYVYDMKQDKTFRYVSQHALRSQISERMTSSVGKTIHVLHMQQLRGVISASAFKHFASQFPNPAALFETIYGADELRAFDAEAQPDQSDEDAEQSEAAADDEDAERSEAAADDEDAEPSEAAADDEDAERSEAAADDEDAERSEAAADDAGDD
jgi:hypothetical protein